MAQDELDSAFALLQKIRWGGMNTPPAAGMWERDGDNAKKIFGDREDAAGFVFGYLKPSLTWDERDPTGFKKDGAKKVTFEDIPRTPGGVFSPQIVTIPLAALNPDGLKFRIDEELRIHGATGNNETALPPIPPDVRRRIDHTVDIAATRAANFFKKHGLD